MKYLLITILIASASLCYAVPSFQKQYQDDLKAGLCVKEKIALGYERKDIVKINGTCFIK